MKNVTLHRRGDHWSPANVPITDLPRIWDTVTCPIPFRATNGRPYGVRRYGFKWYLFSQTPRHLPCHSEERSDVGISRGNVGFSGQGDEWYGPPPWPLGFRYRDLVPGDSHVASRVRNDIFLCFPMGRYLCVIVTLAGRGTRPLRWPFCKRNEGGSRPSPTVSYF